VEHQARNGDDPVLDAHVTSPGCEVGQRIRASLAYIDCRALAAVEAELETTTQLAVGPTDL
jgi:hypothetical protein